MERKLGLDRKQEICVVFSTAPAADSAALARMLIDRRLVACVNMVPVRSFYRWKGEFCDDEEHLLIIKTRKEKADAVIAAIKAQHPYEVPGSSHCRLLQAICPTLNGCMRKRRDNAGAVHGFRFDDTQGYFL